MKLGICYMVFDGEELLEFAIKSIRNQIDHVAVTYQNTSYHGNKTDISSLIKRLTLEGLIDEAIFFEPDLTKSPKENELNLRNIGLDASRRAGCTHHISSDVDEFYVASQLEYAKKVMDEGDFNYSVVGMSTYYKHPTYLVYPEQPLLVTFIHPVHNEYKVVPYPEFPFHMEITRRFVKCDKYRCFSKDEVVMHHMSYVRKDIRKKFVNNDNRNYYRLNKFYATFDNYQLGGRVCLLPDYLNRKTVLVENQFGINI